MSVPFDYNRVIQLDPDCTQAFCCRGIARLTLQENKAAIEDLNHAITLNPDFANAYLWRGIAYRRIKNSASALSDLQRAADLFSKQGNLNGHKRALQALRGMIVHPAPDFDLNGKLL